VVDFNTVERGVEEAGRSAAKSSASSVMSGSHAAALDEREGGRERDAMEAAARERSAIEAVLAERTGGAKTAAAFAHCASCASAWVGARDERSAGERPLCREESAQCSLSLPLDEVAGASADSATCGCSELEATLSGRESDKAGGVRGAESNALIGASGLSTVEEIAVADMANGLPTAKNPNRTTELI